MKTRLFFVLACAVALLLVVALAAAAKESPPGGESVVSGANAAPAEVEAFTASAAATAPWFKETVDGSGTHDRGQYASVAIDPSSGTTYISYFDVTDKNLRMATYVGSGGDCGPDNAWSCQTVASFGDVGRYSSIAVYPGTGFLDWKLGIAYHDAGLGALKYAQYYYSIYPSPGYKWAYSTIDSGNPSFFVYDGRYTSLAFDSNGKAHIAYYHSILGDDSLMHALYVGSGGDCGPSNSWQCDTVDTGDSVGQYASLALDSSDRPRIAYYDGGNNALMYAYQNGGSWTIRKILPVNSGKYTSLVVDVNNGNLPHIAHFNTTNNKLEYAVYDILGNGNCGFYSDVTKFMWQCDTIEYIGSSSAPRGVDIAVDGAGLPVIAYQNAAEGPMGMGTLKVARPVAALNQLVGNCGPVSLFYTWQCDTLLPLGPYYNVHYRPAEYVGIDLNSAGLATIAYYGNATNDGGDLQVTYQRLQVFLPLVVRD